jgi:exosortase A-associated hydrolase 1
MIGERAVVFSCNGDDLFAILHEGQGARNATGVLVVVGGPQYRVGSHRQFVLIARGLAARGVAVLRFDYRGMGDSCGTQRTFESVDEDIRSAVETFMQQAPWLRRVVILGLCDGASAAMTYAYADPRVHGLILINPWVRTSAGEAKAVLRYHFAGRFVSRAFWVKVFAGEFRFRNSAASLWAVLVASVRKPTASGQAQRSFVERMLDGMTAFHGPVLVLLSENDLTAREFESLCSSSVAWRRVMSGPAVMSHRIRCADHTFSSARSLEDAIVSISEWFFGHFTTECEIRRNPCEK